MQTAVATTLSRCAIAVNSERTLLASNNIEGCEALQLSDMTREVGTVRPLDNYARTQIKAHVEITSLSDAVEQLFRNALDADASDVRITVDFRKGYCACVDDGHGIAPEEFGPSSCLAQAYCTSRAAGTSYFGRNGQALASIAASSLLSITSRQKGFPAHTMVRHHGVLVSSCISSEDGAEDLNARGTKVVLHNLFGNLPVRFKAQALKCSDQIEVERQFHILKRRLVAYLLANAKPVAVSLQVVGTALTYRNKPVRAALSATSFSLECIHNTFRQFAPSLAVDESSWKLSSAKAGGIAIRLATCIKPAPSKHCQFISLGQWPVFNQGIAAILYDTVNDAFDASNFGAVLERSAGSAQQRSSDSSQHHRRKRLVKSVDRWPSFYIRIDCRSSEPFDSDLRNEGQDLQSTGSQPVVELLTLLVNHFLKKQLLQPKRKRMASYSEAPPNLRRSKSDTTHKFSFGAWARTKSAFANDLDDICEGLPFVGQHAPPTSTLDPDVQLLLDDMDLDMDLDIDSFTLDPSLSAQRDVLGGSHDVQSSDGGESSIWINPRTGTTIRLNDTSFVIPKSRHADDCCSADVDTGYVFWPVAKPVRPLSRQQEPKALVERLKQWPVQTFSAKTEAPILCQDLCMEIDSTPSNTVAAAVDEKLKASDLANAQVIRQVDEKFILIAIQQDHAVGSRLALVDQHAADERVKVEQYFRNICEGESSRLSRPIVVESDEEELTRFERARSYLARWGFRYHISEVSQHAICVTHLPQLVAERCRQEPRLLIDLLRTEIWRDDNYSFSSPLSDGSWLDQVAHCPKGLVEMVNSRACRSAIMFNDVLNVAQCKELLDQLAKCMLPLQCAHGRPSLTVLTRVGNIADDAVLARKKQSFGKAYGSWKQEPSVL